MGHRGQVEPGPTVGAIITVLILGFTGLIALPVLSPFAEQCPDDGMFASNCAEITAATGFAISSLIGPGPIIVVIVGILVAIGSAGR